MENYSVYKHTAPNGKSYIGITCRNPIVRWKNGGGYMGQPKFYNAITKYGWDNIKHEILFSGLTEEEAYEKEKELIRFYDSVNNGYNCSTGGEHGREGTRKYKIGDAIENFEIVGYDGVKFILKCSLCGRIAKRYNTSLKNESIKCRCQIKYNPNPKPREWCLITHNGKTQRLSEWSKELGIREETIRGRYRKGQPIDEAIHDPSRMVPCAYCGNDFHSPIRSQKYCCQECCLADQRSKRKIERATAICAYCGNEFTLKRPLDKNYKGMYCSIQCRINHQKQMKQEAANE